MTAPRVAAAVLLLALCGAARAPVFDPALVQGEVLEPRDVRAPYLVRFRKGRRRLTFVAARHEASRDSETMRLIDAAFAADRPDYLLVEGYPNGKGDDPPDFLAYAERTCAAERCPGGEPAYSALKARARGVRFAGGEPDDEDVVPALGALGYSPRDVFAFYFVRMLPQYRREKDYDPATFPRKLKEMHGYHHVAGAEGFGYDDFLAWYRKGNGKDFDPAAFDEDEAAPKCSGALLSQRVSCAVDAVRNRFTVARVGDALAAGRRVMVVYGASHFDMERAAFEKALGRPSFHRLDERGTLVRKEER